MRVLSPSAIAVLDSLSGHCRHHFDFLPDEHAHLGTLWLRHLVSLQPGDVWALSETGRALLARITMLIHAEPIADAPKTADAWEGTVISLAARRNAAALKTQPCHPGS